MTNCVSNMNSGKGFEKKNNKCIIEKENPFFKSRGDGHLRI